MVPSSRACPPQAECWYRSPRATTECEFDLACKPDCQNRLDPWIAEQRRSSRRTSRPDEPEGVLARVKTKPLRGGPHGPVLTRSARTFRKSPRSGRRAGLQSNKELTNHLDTPNPHVSNPESF